MFPKGLSEPGLPLALGGVSVNLWDMTALYVALARGGEAGDLIDEPGTEPTPGGRLMSAEAAAQVLAILRGTPPPPGSLPAQEIGRRPALALKTGTSFGFRDAWAFGVGPRHTVGVWVGRPDGTPSPDRYGRNTAAPLLVRVFDLLNLEAGAGTGAKSWATPPAAAGITQPPALLRRIEAGDPERRPLTLADPERLRLVFPTPGIVLDQSGEPDDPEHPPPSLTLSAAGGTRPLTWIVNGRPLGVSDTRREIQWLPDGPGFTRVTVIDAAGRSASADFQLR
jgi:penicillin-binding protein 1C